MKITYADPLFSVITALDNTANDAVNQIKEAVAKRDRPTITRFSGVLDLITQMQEIALGTSTHEPKVRKTRKARVSTSAPANTNRPKRKYTRKNKAPNNVSDSIISGINESAPKATRRGRKPKANSEMVGKRRGNRAFKAPAGTITSAKEFRPHLLAAFEDLKSASTFVSAQSKMFNTMTAQGLLREHDLRMTKGTDIPRWRACTAATRKSLVAQGVIKQVSTITLEDKPVETYELTAMGKKELAAWKNAHNNLVAAA